MKPRSLQALFLLILAVCFASTVHAGQRTYAVTLIDESPSDSPLRASGRFAFHEESFQTSVKTQWDVDIVISNVSSKNILAYEAEISAIPELGPAIRQIDHPDFFFNRQDMSPGCRRALKLEPGPTAVNSYDPSTPTHTANATFAVFFVEFADGTTYGRSRWGSSLPEARRVFFARLKELNEAYKDRGERALTNALNALLARTDNPSPTRDQIAILKFALDEGGFAALLAKIQESLAAARARGMG